jgi:hypothetical protein
VLHAHLPFQYPGIIHQGGHCPQGFVYGGKQAQDIPLRGHISRHGNGVPPVALDDLDDVGSRLLVVLDRLQGSQALT